MGARLTLLVVTPLLWLLVGNPVAGAPPPSPAPDESLDVYAKPQLRVALPDGRRIHLFCMGEGSPSVILTIGAGGSVIDWSKVEAGTASKTRTCAWDRAGYGYSDPSSTPQDVAHTTTDLEQALLAARVDGPYVMVGQSLGGYESLLFADRHPNQVAGLVLVDPTPLDFVRGATAATPAFFAFFEDFLAQIAAKLKKCAADLNGGSLKIGGPDPNNCFRYPPSYPSELKQALEQLDSNPDRLMSRASLFEQLTHSFEILQSGRHDYGAIPLRVLTATEPMNFGEMPPAAKAEMPSFLLYVRHAHDAIAALSADGVDIVVDGADHRMQQTNPDVIISTVTEVIEKVRSASRTDSVKP